MERPRVSSTLYAGEMKNLISRVRNISQSIYTITPLWTPHPGLLATLLIVVGVSAEAEKSAVGITPRRYLQPGAFLR